MWPKIKKLLILSLQSGFLLKKKKRMPTSRIAKVFMHMNLRERALESSDGRAFVITSV